MFEMMILLSKVAAWGLKIYFWINIIAFLISWVRPDPNSPVVYYINRLTAPYWNWVRSRVPRTFMPMAPILSVLLIEFGEIAIPGIIRSLGAASSGQVDMGSGFINALNYLAIGGLSIGHQITNFIMILAIIWFVMSIISAPINNPFTQTIYYLIDPLISPLQRLLPRMQYDLSPLVLAAVAFFISKNLVAFIYPLQMKLII